jgi:hypothetical protein
MDQVGRAQVSTSTSAFFWMRLLLTTTHNTALHHRLSTSMQMRIRLSDSKYCTSSITRSNKRWGIQYCDMGGSGKTWKTVYEAEKKRKRREEIHINKRGVAAVMACAAFRSPWACRRCSCRRRSAASSPRLRRPRPSRWGRAYPRPRASPSGPSSRGCPGACSP